MSTSTKYSVSGIDHIPGFISGWSLSDMQRMGCRALQWHYKVKLPLDISSSEPWSVHYLLMEDLELDLNGKIADQLPSTTSETKIVCVGPFKCLSCLEKTHFLPAHFKLVLGKDGDQVVMCKEVGTPSRSEDVSNHLDSLAARKEIDLTRTPTVRATKCAVAYTTSRAFACEESDFRLCAQRSRYHRLGCS
ncbi:hypothetical protein GQ600_20748 [Phytophthora cactorum]|nr:hypothetical protein GQ600_20748 [Phytophthora cactorum]